MAMSMRSRGGAGGRSRHGVRPVYEDFKPMSEWKHEEGADVLLFHLPGFVKEQIRILAESKGVLRVFGERFVGGNKWSRFQEEVIVPQDCNMTDIRARFEGGILRITMPKKTITNPTPTPTQLDQPSPKPHESPKTSTPKPDLEARQPQTLQKPDLEAKQPQILQKPDSEAKQPQILQKPDLEAKQPQTVQEKASTSDSKQAQIQEHTKQEEGFDKKSKLQRGEEHDLEGVKDNRNVKAGFLPNIDHKKQVPNYAKEKQAKEGLEGKKESDDDRVEEGKKVNRSQLPSPMSLEEDRQLLVNMGVAVLVIVGLAAYISHSFGSST